MRDFKRMGKFLVKAREELGFETTTAAAKHLGMDRARLSGLENNLIALQTDELIRIADKFPAKHLIHDHCKFNCQLGFYHHIIPDPEIVKNTDRLIGRLYESIEEAYDLLSKMRKHSINQSFDSDPTGVEKFKLLGLLITHDFKAFDLATDHVITNKEIVKKHDKAQKVRI